MKIPAGIPSFFQSVWRVIVSTVRIYGDIDGEQRSASFAYYALVSLFPLFALMLTLGSLLFNSHEVFASIHRLFPIGETQQQLIWEMVQRLEENRGGVSLVSILILIWTSLRFFQALVRGVNRAWHTIEIPWWQLPLKNLLMIGVIGSALVIGLLAPVILQGVRDALLAAESFLHHYFPAFDLKLTTRLIDASRFALGSVILFYSFAMLYMLAPRRKVLFRHIWFPALLVTILLQLCQNAFVNYLPRFVNYNAIYGTVGGMMLLLLWVYVSGIVIMLGACLCPALAGELEGKGVEERIPSSSDSTPSS